MFLDMKLFLLRHGRADWPRWSGPDDERPLTAEGIEEMRMVARALKRLKIAPDAILSSPLPRALKTAEIVGKALGVRVEQRQELMPGFDGAGCDALLDAHPGADVMLVGHEPDFTGLIHSLTGGEVRLSKAGVAAVEIAGELPAPRLLWLFPAKMLIRLYR